MKDFADSKRIGNCLVVTINRPQERNPISVELFAEVKAAFETANKDKSIGAIILTGAAHEGEKSFFCAGGNLRDLAALKDRTPKEQREVLEVLHDFTRLVTKGVVPMIAAVEGGAAGAGCSIALTCDFIVSAEDAKFSVAYVNVGLTPDGGVTSFLADILPRQLANEMCLLGKQVAAQRFYDLGAINAITPAGQTLAAALELGEKLAKGPRQTIANIKQLCAAAPYNDLDEQLELEAKYMIDAQASPEAAEGIGAFFGKRKADYTKLR